MDNTRKRNHSPDGLDERGDRMTSSVPTGTDPDTQSASVQEPGPSVEDQPAAVDTPAEVICPICLGAAIRQGGVKRLRCSHEFHQSCVDKWLNSNRSCPLCRTPIPRRRMRRPQRNRRPRARTYFTRRPRARV